MTSLGVIQRPHRACVSLAYKSENVLHGNRNIFVSNPASVEEGGWLAKRIGRQLDKECKQHYRDVTRYHCVAIGCRDVTSGSQSIYVNCLPRHTEPGNAIQREPVTAKDREEVKARVQRLQEMSKKTGKHMFNCEDCETVVAGESCRVIAVNNGYVPNGTTTRRPPSAAYRPAHVKVISRGHSWSENKAVVVGSGNVKVDLQEETVKPSKS